MTRATKAFHKPEFIEATPFKELSKPRRRFNSNKITIETSPTPSQSTPSQSTPSQSTPSQFKKPKIMSAEKRLKEIERRRKRRQLGNFDPKKTCFNCRKVGHSLVNCRSQLKDANTASGICYKCGSTEHSISKCKKQTMVDAPFPFATCFLCKQQGHITASCPGNEKGVYPKGGSCKFCGSVRHLAKDCKPIKEKGAIELGVADGDDKGDDDDLSLIARKMAEHKKLLKKSGKKDGKKVVVF